MFMCEFMSGREHSKTVFNGIKYLQVRGEQGPGMSSSGRSRGAFGDRNFVCVGRRSGPPVSDPLLLLMLSLFVRFDNYTNENILF